MDSFEKLYNLVEGSEKNLLENELVLIVAAYGDKNISSFDDLTNDKVKRVALGEPKGVPVGQYSEEILTALNILDAVKEKSI